MNAELKKLQEETGVRIWDGKVVVSSRDVAKNFGKRHDSVMRRIRSILSHDTEHYFSKSTFVHPTNKREYPEYLIDQGGFTLVLNRSYDRETVYKYLNAFSKMEKELGKRTPAEILAAAKKAIKEEQQKDMDPIERFFDDGGSFA